jgi:hypothetical protein
VVGEHVASYPKGIAEDRVHAAPLRARLHSNLNNRLANPCKVSVAKVSSSKSILIQFD